MIEACGSAPWRWASVLASRQRLAPRALPRTPPNRGWCPTRFSARGQSATSSAGRWAGSRCSLNRSRDSGSNSRCATTGPRSACPRSYDDPDLASFNGATTQTSANDPTHFVRQAVGVFATNDAAGRAFHRVTDRTVGCSGQTTAMHLDNGTTQVWSFDGGPPSATDAGLDQTASGHRSAMLRSNPAARKRIAAGEGLPIWQRRACGQRAGRGNAERARASSPDEIWVLCLSRAAKTDWEFVGGRLLDEEVTAIVPVAAKEAVATRLGPGGSVIWLLPPPSPPQRAKIPR